MFEAGVEIITSGNHIWHYREIYAYLDGEAPLLRPLNYPQGAPGRGVIARDGVAVINLIGRTFMPGMLDCPVRAASFLSQPPTRFTTDERGPVVFNSVLVQVDPETGKAGSIQRIDCEVAGWAAGQTFH